MVKSMFGEISRILHPRTMKKVHMDGHIIDEPTLRSVNMFIMAYIVLFSFSVLIVSWDNFDMTTNFTAVAATLNNIGPGLNMVGPMGNFSEYSDVSKYVFCFDMLAGRLELFPILVLFNPKTWNRQIHLHRHNAKKAEI